MIDGPINIMSNHFKIQPSHQDYAELLQITDTHIFADKKERFDDIDTNLSLNNVLNLARGSNWPVDALLATGDLVHNARTIAYERLLKVFTEIEEPIFCLPGNHDSPALMHKLLNTNNVHTLKSIEIGSWLIIMLDSFLPNTHAGLLKQHDPVFDGLPRRNATWCPEQDDDCVHQHATNGRARCARAPSRSHHRTSRP